MTMAMKMVVSKKKKKKLRKKGKHVFVDDMYRFLFFFFPSTYPRGMKKQYCCFIAKSWHVSRAKVTRPRFYLFLVLLFLCFFGDTHKLDYARAKAAVAVSKGGGLRRTRRYYMLLWQNGSR